jgi:hypothetical protein
VSRWDTFVRPVISFEARCINLAAENGHFLHIAFRPMTVVAVGRAAKSAQAAGLAAVFKDAATGLRHRELSSVTQFQGIWQHPRDSRMFP